MIEDAIVSDEGVRELLVAFFGVNVIDIDDFIRSINKYGKCTMTGSMATPYPYKIKAFKFRSRG